jgi:hypothetical protein
MNMLPFIPPVDSYIGLNFEVYDLIKKLVFNYVGSRKNSKLRKLKSVYWKEFELIYHNGEISNAKCIHCHDRLSAREGIGTSHLKRHLFWCKER